jgi:chemotaxis protein CheX
MNADFINPFLEALMNVLNTMANTPSQPEKPFLKKDSKAKGDITGIIGMAGENIKGYLAISYTEPVILHVASQMLGETFTEINDVVVDIASEITNMVMGGAKKTLSEKGYQFGLSIPTTVTGKNHIISNKTSGPTIIVPFKTEIGDFFTEICLDN